MIPPQGHDDYDLPVMAWNTDLYAQAVDEGYVTDEEVEWLLDEAEDQPAAWRYAGDSEAVKADTEVESPA